LIVPGNVEGSYLYERISYPAGDGELMPPPDDGYERMADAEIALIAAWIAAGASLEGSLEGGDESASVSETQPLAEPADVVIEEVADANQVEDQVFESADPFGVQGAADAGALSALLQAGALAGRVAADTQAVEADLHLLRDGVGDEQLDWLAGLESHLVNLHLGGTAVSDAGLAASLSSFTELRSLNVSRTAAGTATVAAAAALPHLEVLNLYGTQVTDADVLALAGAPALERLYLWDSQVTPEGGRALAELRPDLKIDPAEWFAEPKEEVVELPPAEAVDYATQIAPIFEARCVTCHGANEPKAGLRLDDLAAHFARPEADWVLLPGDPDGSPLIRRVEYGASTQGAMPPKGERLELAQIELLRTWILQGAEY
jgi:mono/diheme cytochrome c family protein